MIHSSYPDKGYKLERRYFGVFMRRFYCRGTLVRVPTASYRSYCSYVELLCGQKQLF